MPVSLAGETEEEDEPHFSSNLQRALAMHTWRDKTTRVDIQTDARIKIDNSPKFNSHDSRRTSSVRPFVTGAPCSNGPSAMLAKILDLRVITHIEWGTFDNMDRNPGILVLHGDL